MFLLLNFSNPMLWVLILAAIFLLFGGSKLPQLAKALGQSKKAFKEGMSEADEAEDEARKRKEVSAAQPASLSAIDDEALFDEARRRARLIREDRK
jgi:sec-independent protein translocase protein TatA